MEKNTAIIKKLVVVAIILTVVTISIISFVGVYAKDLNKMSDVMQDYVLSTEFEGNREYRFTLDTNEEEKEVYVDSNGNICGDVISDSTVDAEIIEENSDETESNTEETQQDNTENNIEDNTENDIEGYTKEKRTIKANDDSVLTKESYKKSKSIIEERLDKLGATEYNIRLDEVTGELVVELPDNENSDFLYQAISSKGNFQIIDSQTGLELMNNSNIKKVGAVYDRNEKVVYLQISFNKKSFQKLQDISNNYKEVKIEESTNTETSTETEENIEENTEESIEYTENQTEVSETQETTETPKTEIKYIEIKLDGSNLMKTYFGEEINNGMIQIPLNQSITDDEVLKNTIKSANGIAVVLNSGEIPNSYILKSDNFIQSTISKNIIDYVKITVAIVLVIISLIYIIKYGLNGILGSILNIGYLAIVTLAMRYTGVVITISSVITIFGIIIINSGFMNILLKEIKDGINAKKAYLNSMKKLYLSIVPICIVAFVFTFIKNASVTGIGMVLFWGIIIQALYSVIFTRTIYVLNDK